MRRLLAVLCLTGACWAPVSLAAQYAAPRGPSPDVAVDDPAYVDLDVLIARGLIRRVMVGDRPYTVQRFAAMIEEATERATTVTLQPREREVLERLQRRFDLQALPRTLTMWRGTATLASTVARPMRAINGSRAWLDADLDPLLQGNFGRVVDDGPSVALDGSWAGAARHIAGGVSGRASLSSRGGVKLLPRLEQAYVRFVAAPFQLDLGRADTRFGYGIDGGSLVSNNARALDGVRLHFNRPYGASEGPLSLLGMWQLSSGFYWMGDNRDNPGSVLSLTRISGKLGPWVEGGMTFAAVQLGAHAPSVGDLGSFLNTAYLIGRDWWNYADGGDKIASADLRLAVPSARLGITADFFSTDTRMRFQDSAHGYWEDAVWIVGMEQAAVGPGGRWDWRAEWKHAGPDTHGHGQWTSGVTTDRRTIGDPMGPNAEGLGLRLRRDAAAGLLTVTVRGENYFSSDYAMMNIEPPRPPKWTYWKKLSDGVTEHRTRITAAWDRRAPTRGYLPRFELGWERVNRFRFTHGTADNLLIGLSIRRP